MIHQSAPEAAEAAPTPPAATAFSWASALSCAPSPPSCRPSPLPSPPLSRSRSLSSLSLSLPLRTFLPPPSLSLSLPCQCQSPCANQPLASVPNPNDTHVSEMQGTDCCMVVVSADEEDNFTASSTSMAHFIDNSKGGEGGVACLSIYNSPLGKTYTFSQIWTQQTADTII